MNAKTPNVCRDAALEFLELGFSVIPIKPGDIEKKPLIFWKKYQNQLPTEEEIYEWWEKWPNANVGIITGGISKIFVVDCDGPKAIQWALENLPATSVCVSTGREGGLHLYYRLPSGCVINNSVSKLAHKVDVRGEGGYVVAPPSIHENGKQYELNFAEGLRGWEELTEFDLESIKTKKGPGIDLSGVKPMVNIEEPAKEGCRNSRLAEIAGHYFASGLALNETLNMCLDWNSRNEKPLSNREVENTVNSIYKTHIRNHQQIASEAAIEGTNNFTSITEIDQENAEPYLDGGDIATYPDEVLHPGGLMEEIMDFIEKTSAASVPLFNLAASITILGAIAAMKVQTETGLKTNFYTISIGHSGTGKDAGNKSAQRLLKNTAAQGCLAPSELASASGFLKHLAQPSYHNALFALDEIGMLIKGLQQPTSPNAELPRLVTKLFSSAGQPETKAYADPKNSYVIPWQHVCIYGSTTPSAFWSALVESDTLSGFLARLLIFESHEDGPYPKPSISDMHPHNLVKKLMGIYNIKTNNSSGGAKVPQPHVICKTPEAAAFFETFARKYYDLRNKFKAHPAISSIYARVAEHAHKLALIHAVSLHGKNIIKNKVGLESVEWATKLAAACAQKTIEGIQDNISQNDWHAVQQRLIRLIKTRATNERPGVTIREIFQQIKQSKKQILDILESMQHAGIIFQQKYQGRRGPPTVIFCLRKNYGDGQEPEPESEPNQEQKKL